MTERDQKLEDEIAALIAEHVGVGYQLRPDGLADPETLKVYAHGAAHVVIHRLRSRGGEYAPTNKED